MAQLRPRSRLVPEARPEGNVPHESSRGVHWNIPSSEEEQLTKEEMRALQDNITGASLTDVRGLAREFFHVAWIYRYVLLILALVLFALSANLMLQGRPTGRTRDRVNQGFKEAALPGAGEQEALRAALVRARVRAYLGGGVLLTETHATATAAAGSERRRLPGEFYLGVHYGISAWAWEDTLRGGAQPRGGSSAAQGQRDAEATRRLRRALAEMAPKPTAVYKSQFENEDAEYYSEGFLVYFSAEDLKRQEAYIHKQKRSASKTVTSPWRHAQQAVLRIARQFGQISVLSWVPIQWGDNEGMHTNIIQEIIPTRAGLQKMRAKTSAYKALT